MPKIEVIVEQIIEFFGRDLGGNCRIGLYKISEIEFFVP
jgi:hypothetical protein